MEKSEILKEFSSDPERYYKVALFEEKNFERKSCAACKRYFWTRDSSRMRCPDHQDDAYSFIGSPPTSKRFDYAQAWRQVESFFKDNGHASVSRYPVVCRWRDDLFFTIASVVDFQRVMGSKVVFELPANPLIVPQTCLRFKDLENVGVTGRHFSSFCMIGQHAIDNDDGYWKDRCIDLDYRLLTERFGIPGDEITFVEDVWAGGGSFGSSLEYFVRGLELGNAVFTEFQGELGQHATLSPRIIDMGAGLERFAWITMGTPTAYDCSFQPAIDKITSSLGLDADSAILAAYYARVASALGSSEDAALARDAAARECGISSRTMDSLIIPLEGAYLIADHLRTLIFAIADGALPSNVGGGYNLRVMLRRIADAAERIGLKLDMSELVDAHIGYLENTYPELAERRKDIKTILDIESDRYRESKSRMSKIAMKISEAGEPSVDELVTFYESDGITPDYLREIGAISQVPPTFYTRISELHQPGKKSGPQELDIREFPETRLLYYEDDPMEFDAKVLGTVNNLVILDRTSFYARGGGQEPDRGVIGACEVSDVERHAGVVLHRVAGTVPNAGDTVRCRVDKARRLAITKHHTSTHILNASSRKVLGSWVWQHSAFKDADHARLDITHHSPLTKSEAQRIEDEANRMVAQNLPVSIQYLDRGTAEQRYGFRIYQGGVVPVRQVRIVSIQDHDVEACGGTHVPRTGDIKTIKIARTKRIQDGVVRLEFVAGDAAGAYLEQKQEGEAKLKLEKREREQVLQAREERRAVALHDMPILLQCISDGIAAGAAAPGAVHENTVPGNTVPRSDDSEDAAPQNAAHACVTLNVKGSECICTCGRTPDSGIERWRAGGGWFYCTTDPKYGERFHVKFGDRLTRIAPDAAYCAMFEAGGRVRVMAYAGDQAGAGADAIASAASSALGGSSGGSRRLAQGGGKDASKICLAMTKAREAAQCA